MAQVYQQRGRALIPAGFGALVAHSDARIMQSQAKASGAMKQAFIESRTSMIDSLRSYHELWSQDQRWANKAKFVDARASIICGGGGCNIPSCTFQMWDVDVPCDDNAFESVMSQSKRYAAAQLALEGVVKAAPTSVVSIGNGAATSNLVPNTILGAPWYRSVNKMQRGRALWDHLRNAGDPLYESMNGDERGQLAVQAHQAMMASFGGSAKAWAAWAKSVLEHVAVMRWASNVRWHHAVDGDWRRVCPQEWAWLGNAADDRTYYRFHHENGEYPNAPPLQLSWSATMHDQLGADLKYNYKDDTRRRRAPWPHSRYGSGADRLPPLAGGTDKVPVRRSDFSPEGMFFLNDVGTARLSTAFLEKDGFGFAMPTLYGPGASYWKLFPEAWGREAFAGGFEAQLEAWIAAGQTLDGTVKFLSGEFNGLPHPYFVLGWVAAVAADALSVDFFSVTVQSMTGWTRYYEKMPENLRALPPSQLLSKLRDQQSAIDAEKAAYVGTALSAAGAAAGIILAAASGTGPWGAIVGAVVAVITLVAGLFIAYAYEIGIDRMANPPCPAPPFVRMIPTTAEGGQTCDFNAERVTSGNTGVSMKASAIATLAANGIDTSQWRGVLRQLEEGGAPAQEETTPAPAVPVKAIAATVGAAVGVALIKVLFVGRI